MSFLLWQRDAAAAIGSSRLVFRAAEVPLLADAQVLCDRLSAEHASAGTRITQAVAAAREASYAQGLAEGRDAGRELVAATLTTLTESANREREALRGEVASLALEVVRKLLGQLDHDAVLAALAATAAHDLIPGTALSLIVHASEADAVRARIAKFAPDLACDVRGEASVAIDTCCLETEHGSVDASLIAQLERLEAAWGIQR
jgi:flagellar biosynthesis/type III secretory pathway protein FliH